jgi:hypothetical protein
MAAVPITFLNPIATVDPATDPMVIVDVTDISQAPSGTTKKVLPNQIIAANHNASFGNLNVIGYETVAGNFTVNVDKFFVNSSTGQVGIGTTSPSLTGAIGLHAKNAGGTSEIKAESSNANLSLQALNGVVNLWSSSNSTIVVGNNGTTKLAVYTDGRTAFADYLESAALPVITNLFDQNTGIFFPDDDQIAISTGGVERVSVDESGILHTSEDVLVGGNARINDLTASQVVFTDGTKYLESKTPVDARTALQTTTYTHTQSVSANPWIVNHNLNAFPTVWVIDPLGRAGWTEVEYVNSNTLKVHFPGDQTGTAYLNF